MTAISEDKIDKLISICESLGPSMKKTTAIKPCSDKLPINMHICLTSISHGNKSMSDLKYETGISSQQLTRIISDLESLGYVIRQIDPTNRRRVIAIKTAKADEYFEKMKCSGRNMLKSLLEQYNSDDLDELIFHLEKIKDILKK